MQTNKEVVCIVKSRILYAEQGKSITSFACTGQARKECIVLKERYNSVQTKMLSDSANNCKYVKTVQARRAGYPIKNASSECDSHNLFEEKSQKKRRKQKVKYTNRKTQKQKRQTSKTTVLHGVVAQGRSPHTIKPSSPRELLTVTPGVKYYHFLIG